MIDLISSLKYIVVLMNFIIIYVLKKAKNKAKPDSAATNKAAEACLLLIAHPDDESMFFVPLIQNLKYKGYKVHVLCLSNGGSKIREDELKKAATVLNIDKLKICNLEDKGIVDGMNKKWNNSVIFSEIIEYCTNEEIKALFTFDKYGVSGHLNHIALYNTVGDNIDKFKGINIYTLESVNILRKFISILDFFSVAVFELYLVVYDFLKDTTRSDNHFSFFNFNFLLNIQAMKAHRSQFVWFRKLFVGFSRYTYINTFKRIN